jgi:hypothetical protein
MERKGVSAESMQKSHTNLEGSPAFFRLNPRSLKCFWLCCPPISSSSAFRGDRPLACIHSRHRAMFFQGSSVFRIAERGRMGAAFSAHSILFLAPELPLGLPNDL